MAREIHGESAEWAVTEHLLATVVDHLATGNWMFAAAHTPPRRRPPDPPKPVPRPEAAAEAMNGADGQHQPSGTAEHRKKAATNAEIAAFFGRLGA